MPCLSGVTFTQRGIELESKDRDIQTFILASLTSKFKVFLFYIYYTESAIIPGRKWDRPVENMLEVTLKLSKSFWGRRGKIDESAPPAVVQCHGAMRERTQNHPMLFSLRDDLLEG